MPEDMDDLLDAPKDTTEDAPEDTLEGEMGDDDLDAMLKALMEEDSENTWVPTSEREEEEQEVESEAELDVELLEYKPAEEAEEPGEEKEKRNLIKVLLGGTITGIGSIKTRLKTGLANAKENNGKLYKIMLGMFGGVILAGIGLIVLVFIERGGREIEEPLFITSPTNAANHTSFIFVDVPILFADHMIQLTHIALSPLTTAFYFEGDVDLNLYRIELISHGGLSYARDITTPINHEREYVLNRTPIYFAGLNPDEESFTLRLTHIASRHEFSIEMHYTQDSISPGRFLQESVAFGDASVDGVSIYLNHANFSSLASSIGIGIEHNFTDGDVVFITATGAASPVTLRHRHAIVPPITGLMQEALFDTGTTVARIDFRPLTTLTGEVELLVDGLYRLYEIPYTIPASSISTQLQPRDYVIELSHQHRINIHGLTRQGPMIIMPLFGERLRTHQGLNYEGELVTLNTRMATTVTASLVGIDAAGNEHRLQARVNFDDRGTDVLFDTRLNPVFENIPDARLWVEIEEISVRLPQIVHRLDLSQARSVQNESLAMIAVLNHLESLRQTGVQASLSAMHASGNYVYAIIMERQESVYREYIQETFFEHAVRGTISQGNFIPSSVETRLIEQEWQRDY